MVVKQKRLLTPSVKMKWSRTEFLMFAFIFIHLHVVSSQTYNEAVTLLRNKTFFYEKSLRPVTNQSSTLIVNVRFDLVSIQAFDEVQESLTVIGGLTLTWTDDLMKWNPADYSGMVDIVSESGKFWTPYLILTNSVNKLDKVGESWQRIRFTHKGVAVVIQADTWSTMCKADVKYYPWDDHWCGFEFSSAAYGQNEMTLQPVSDAVSTQYYTESGTWELKGSDIHVRYENSSVLFRIHIARKPLFVLVNVVVPIIAMTFLNAMIFVIPADSGERISYSITVLLAIAVFLTLVGENLPKTSNPMPVFSFYLLAVLLISMVITFANIFSLRLYHHNNTGPVKGVFATLTKCVLHVNKCKKENKTVDRANASTKENKTGNKTNVNKLDLSTGYEIEDNSVYACRSCSFMNTDITWKEVSVTFDKICLVVFNILLVLAAFVFFMCVYTKKKKM
ncbi:acetylcholine receptor subunit beta-type unc-29-like [Mercenaria mercenaria]|uniref:acetylcholine receptor subunit beta-type unc-29-like n=1 Tax=Mercenaria mercenaria TaxID=6596 RepID=UPI00234E5226|nr:acetylcholine receptor subunit beta-type unc-29-like [Mercenaria mercenaria]